MYSGDILQVLERLILRITPNSTDRSFLTRDGVPDYKFQVRVACCLRKLVFCRSLTRIFCARMRDFCTQQSLLCEVRAVDVLRSLLQDSIFKLVDAQKIMDGGKMGSDRCGSKCSFDCVCSGFEHFQGLKHGPLVCDSNHEVGPFFLRLVQYTFKLMTLMAKGHPGNSRMLFKYVQRTHCPPYCCRCQISDSESLACPIKLIQASLCVARSTG